MILNNTQANIFKVNGGIADNFANRPAASGSFYIFYSIDTQEIFYDNGAWVLLGSGGGGGVNIYNSDGTLTGNRKLFANNFQLTFQDINILEINGPLLNNGRTFVIDNTNKTYQIGDIDGTFNRTFLEISDINPYIKTSYGSNDIGLKLDFANNNYQFGDGNTYYLSIDATNQNISLNCNNVAFSIYADNINKYITIGQTSDQAGFTFYNDFNNGIFVAKMGDPLGLVNECTFSVDSLNQIIKTTNQNNDIGLKLDFANTTYKFGQITGGNTTYLEILDTAKQINTLHNGIYKGFSLDFNLDLYKFGQHSSISNNTFFEINDNSKVINAYFNNGINGLQLDFTNRIYFLGQLNSGNATKLIISDSGREIYTSINNSANGLLISQSNDVYKFGVINGGNVTNITITDGAVYPIRLNGTNLSSGTAGGASGQHLKININGVNYKIELRNP